MLKITFCYTFTHPLCLLHAVPNEDLAIVSLIECADVRNGCFHPFIYTISKKKKKLLLSEIHLIESIAPPMPSYNL